MLNIEALRKDFDEFLTKYSSDMTNAEVVKKAIETEDLMFTYAG